MDRAFRLILTMLALVAGLGSAPVQARFASADAAEVERVESLGGIGLVAAAAQVQARTAGERRDRDPPRPRPQVTTIVVIPTIQFGDRARE